MVILPQYNYNITKENKPKKCEEYRTLSFLTHTSNILINIILGRIEKKIDENPAEVKFGFRKKSDTRQAILCLRNIVQEIFTVD
jgi:hypothetical protein